MNFARTALILLLISACTDQKKPEPVPPSGPAGQAKLKAAVFHEGVASEVIRKDQFSYVRVGEDWYALVAADIRPGQRVKIEEQAVFNGFESKTLHRTFKKIIFGVIHR